MCVEVRVVFVTADMIPMYMCRHSSHRLIRQFFYFFGDVADAKSCINEQTPLAAFKQVAMSFLPMPVFTYNMSICINAQQRRGWRDAEIGEQACAIVDAVFACGRNASDADKALAEAW